MSDDQLSEFARRIKAIIDDNTFVVVANNLIRVVVVGKTVFEIEFKSPPAVQSILINDSSGFKSDEVLR